MSDGNEAIGNRVGNNVSAEIKLSVSVDEANQILEALGNLPFARVYELVGKVQRQAREQLEGAPSPEREPALPPLED